jgi:hypothetical protein
MCCLCLIQGRVAGLLQPRPFLNKLSIAQSNRKFCERHNNLISQLFHEKSGILKNPQTFSCPNKLAVIVQYVYRESLKVESFSNWSKLFSIDIRSEIAYLAATCSIHCYMMLDF